MGYTIKEKSLAIAKGLDIEQSKISREYFLARQKVEREFILTKKTKALDYIKRFKEVDEKYKNIISQFEHWTLAAAVNNSKYKRVQRIKSRVKDIVLSGSAIFVTLTFTDIVLKATSEETRKKYIKRYLKENSAIYVANKDFGSTNGREHYHAIVSAPTNLDLSQWNHYGAINVKRIRSSTKDLTKVTKYVGKLTNHAIKETAKNHRLIYSR
jgi:hypothetical protein